LIEIQQVRDTAITKFLQQYRDGRSDPAKIEAAIRHEHGDSSPFRTKAERDGDIKSILDDLALGRE
jgi:hypothetical protein